MRHREIAKEIERRQKNLEHLQWVMSTNLTKWHKANVIREIEEEQIEIARLNRQLTGVLEDGRYTGSATLEP